MPQPDRYRLVMQVSDQMLHVQGAFTLWESGALDEETWEAYLAWGASVLSSPGGLECWRDIKAVFVGRMRDEVDARICSGE